MPSVFCPRFVLHLGQKQLLGGKMTTSTQNSSMNPNRRRRGRLNCNALTYLVDCIRYFNTFKFFQWDQTYSTNNNLNNKCFKCPKQNLREAHITVYFTLRPESTEPALETGKLPMHFGESLLLSNSSNQKRAL